MAIAPSAKKAAFVAVALLAASAAAIGYASAAPSGFPTDVSVSVPKGATLSETADFLQAHDIIRSTTLFKLYALAIDGSTTGLKTGDYLFTAAEPAFRVAYRLVTGDEGFPVEKVTVPEGASSTQIASIIERQIPGFDARGFVAAAASHEGYLFPETYFWPTNATPDRVISDMTARFDAEIATSSVRTALASSTRSLSDIVGMAAILEREATSSHDRRIVAGILWKRLDAGMPLQVDSAPETYKNKGLPARPIADPGIQAILDAATPIATPYWYYLSDSHGVLHYAATLQGHAENKNRYL